MSGNIWDKLGSLTPTTDAAVATSGGDGWAFEATSARYWTDPPTIRTPHCPQTLAQGLLGKRIGRLTPLGIVLGTNPKKKAVWLCRCVCGDYAGYTAAALRAAKEDLACARCERVKAIQVRAAKPSTAKSRARAAKQLDAIARGRAA